LDKLTVEIGWDRTFWSSFEKLDFLYSPELTGTPYALFDVILRKNWDDSDAYRLGLSYAWNEQWTSTFGVAYERTPVPASTLGFELPDSNAMMYCAGIRYRYSADLEYGLSYMYYRTNTRTIDAANDGNLSGIDGRFTDGGAHALTIGLIATF
jgi:long-chain fatty acid transport protein